MACFAPATEEERPEEADIAQEAADRPDAQGSLFDEPVYEDEDEQDNETLPWGADAPDARHEVTPGDGTRAPESNRFWSSALYRFLTNRKVDADFLRDDGEQT